MLSPRKCRASNRSHKSVPPPPYILIFYFHRAVRDPFDSFSFLCRLSANTDHQEGERELSYFDGVREFISVVGENGHVPVAPMEFAGNLHKINRPPRDFELKNNKTNSDPPLSSSTSASFFFLSPLSFPPFTVLILHPFQYRPPVPLLPVRLLRFAFFITSLAPGRPLPISKRDRNICRLPLIPQ